MAELHRLGVRSVVSERPMGQWALSRRPESVPRLTPLEATALAYAIPLGRVTPSAFDGWMVRIAYGLPVSPREIADLRAGQREAERVRLGELLEATGSVLVAVEMRR